MVRRVGQWDVLPYGHLSWMTPVCTFFATCFFLFPAFRCSLVVQRSPYGDLEIWYGYWNLENIDSAKALGPEDDSNVCIGWSDQAKDSMFDGWLKSGKAFGVLGAISTILTATFNIVLLFSRLHLKWFYRMVVIHLINAFMTFWLLVILHSYLCKSLHCVLARAGYVAIIGGFLWLIGALLYLVLRKAELLLLLKNKPIGVDTKDIEDDDINNNTDRYHDPEDPRLEALPWDYGHRNEPSTAGTVNSSPDNSQQHLALPAASASPTTTTPRRSSNSPRPKRNTSTNDKPFLALPFADSNNDHQQQQQQQYQSQPPKSPRSNKPQVAAAHGGAPKSPRPSAAYSKQQQQAPATPKSPRPTAKNATTTTTATPTKNQKARSNSLGAGTVPKSPRPSDSTMTRSNSIGNTTSSTPKKPRRGSSKNASSSTMMMNDVTSPLLLSPHGNSNTVTSPRPKSHSPRGRRKSETASSSSAAVPQQHSMPASATAAAFTTPIRKAPRKSTREAFQLQLQQQQQQQQQQNGTTENETKTTLPSAPPIVNENSTPKTKKKTRRSST